ncbi:MAG: helix-turn-helix transcriptional regulator [Bacteroidales bacterium]|jgi:transcriptional regulator with XRE-family HTH domain|nr:helix-turn-helix transcriptional regulator [Bacteroidales bacterium]
MDWNSLSNASIAVELGKRVRATRMRKRLTQRELAVKAGISLFSVAQIERGHPVSVGIFIPVLRVLRLLDNLEMLLPEIGPGPIEILKQKGKTPMRVRSKKQK